MTIQVDWDLVPDATHYCPETDENRSCYYKQDSNGTWLGKLNDQDDWDYKVCVDEHTLENMIAKEE